MSTTATAPTTTTLAAITVAAALLLSGCAANGGGGADAANAGAGAKQADAVEIRDAWIKAVPAKDGMTGAFGELANTSGAKATVVAASTPVAGMVELHEVVTGDDGNAVMREKDGGLDVGADGTHTLEPGADHIMLMDLKGDLDPGTEVDVELEFADGSTTTFTAPVKEYEGANENYDGDADHNAGH